MSTYKNRNYVRDHNCTNVVACVAAFPPDGKAPDVGAWLESGAWLLKNLTHLYTQNDVKYYGHL